MAYRLRCRKGYRKPEWGCKILHNGSQRGSYGVKKGKVGFTLLPYGNVGCGTELSEILSAVKEVLQNGRCEIGTRPRVISKTKGGKMQFQNYGADHQCLMDELKKELKKRRVKNG